MRGSVRCAPGLVNLAAAASGEAEDEEEEQDNIWDTLVDEVMTEVKSTMDPAQGHSETAARAALVCQSLEGFIVARFEMRLAFG